MKKRKLLVFVLLSILFFDVLTAVLAHSKIVENSEYFDTSDRSTASHIVQNKSAVVNTALTSETSTIDRTNRRGLMSWKDFAKKDDESTAELVIGVDSAFEENYASLETLIQSNNGKITKTIYAGNEIKAVVVDVPIDFAPILKDRLATAKLSRYIEPNVIVQAFFTPNDFYWYKQWAPQKIEADWAWNTTVGSHSVLAAVVDTGVDYLNPDLAPNYVPLGYDWVNSDNFPKDDYGHGTHCAGILAAVLNNSYGIAGIAQVSLMAEKCLNDQGWGYESDCAQGIIHAVDQGAKIISCSWGSFYPSEVIHDAVKYATSKGALVFAAAGNTGNSVQTYPASYDEVIAVTATDIADNLADFSTYGEWVEVSAPGVGIFSLLHNGLFKYASGTSMACPHAAAVGALIWSRFPNLTNMQVKQAVLYATDDLGTPGFDVYYGYGRINARKGVEQTISEHDINVWGFEIPPYVEPNGLGLVNTTIYNAGTSDENGITVQLLANGTVVSSKVIPFLASDSLTNVTLTWNPQVEGKYNLTVYIPPVTGETNLRCNSRSGYVDVGFPLRVAVVDSTGAHMEYIIYAVWDQLNKNWRNFGDKMIHIDYTSLAKPEFSYDDINATKADVLFISCADYREYTDEEIDAITKYVYEGHGLIGTAFTLSPYSPKNDKLGLLFGIVGSLSWGINGTDILNALDPTHPILRNVPTSFNTTELYTVGCIPEDGHWSSNELLGGTYIALGNLGQTAIVTYRGLVYIAPFLEYSGAVLPRPLPNTFHLQLLYNAVTWSKFQRPEHEVIVSFKAPGLVIPNEKVGLYTIISNIGSNNETNVRLRILVNGSVIFSYSVSNLASCSDLTLYCQWQPTVVGVYNVTALVDPVQGEDNVWNNVKSMWIIVRVPPDILIVDDNTESGAKSSAPEIASALDTCGIDYYVWDKMSKGSPSLDILSRFKLVIWSCSSYLYQLQITTGEAKMLVSYAKQGGKIILDGWDIAYEHYGETDFEMYVLHGRYKGWTWPWLGGTEGIDVVTKDSLVVCGLPDRLSWTLSTTPSHVNGISPLWGGMAVANYTDNPHPVPPPGNPAPLPVVKNWGAVVVSEDHQGNGGQTIFYSFPFFSLSEQQRFLLVKNSLSWMFPKEHEVYVNFLNSFKDGVHDKSVPAWINVTVGNWGKYNETNLQMQIMINEKVVNSTTILRVDVHSHFTYSFLWKFEKLGNNSVTVQVLPVAGEDTIYDNVITTTVNVKRLVVALMSEENELKGIIPILESMGIGCHIYNRNMYFGYSSRLDILLAHRVVIMMKTGRATTLAEYTALQSYLASGGNLLVTGLGCLLTWSRYSPLTVDSYMCDVVRAKCFGLYDPPPKDVPLYAVNETHPILDGNYGKFAGYCGSVYFSSLENATADASKNAFSIVKCLSPDSPVGKIIAVSNLPGRVAYWNGRGYTEWTIHANCQTILKNIIAWLEFGWPHDLKCTLEVPDSIEVNSPVTLKATIRNSGYHDENNVTVSILINGLSVATVKIPTIVKRIDCTLEYLWVPSRIGTYNITAYAPLIQEECNDTNNMCFTLAIVQGEAPVLGDINNDGLVNVLDATEVGWNWMKTVPSAPKEADLNGDGIIDKMDALVICMNWQKHA